MNKQELIEKYEGKQNKNLSFELLNAYIDFIRDLQQLDEPQKVTVPPEVSVWYQINKDNLDKNIAYLCLHNFGDFINDKTLFNWMSNTDNFIQTLVNMHQFGYEVEKEKRYLVKIKATGQCLGKYYINNEILCPRFIYTGRNADAFTRKELEDANFGWVFDCEGIEIEEVE
nr:MAG TPA: Protein of unknown function (DUF1642) [Caudoviricetes sp.]